MYERILDFLSKLFNFVKIFENITKDVDNLSISEEFCFTNWCILSEVVKELATYTAAYYSQIAHM